MFSTVVCLCLILSAGAGQDSSPPAADTTVAARDNDELAALRKDFSNVYGSLRATGGVTAADHGVIESVRDRAAAYNERYPDDATGLALELQLSQWLDDAPRVNDLFPRLAEATGDVRIGLAWIRFAGEADDRKQIGYVHGRLAELFPDNVGIAGGWADFYKEANLYGRAVEILEASSIDPVDDPEAAILLSECLFAEQRYQEAADLLASVPDAAVVSDPAVNLAVGRDLVIRREYVELWDAELQIRSLEAAADDLPRAELITSQGPILVELFENEAPNTVANFISLAEQGYFDGTTFHRVLPNFMAQGGDPNTRPGGDGTPGLGGPGYRIPDELGDGARNHFTGSLAMGNTGTPNTGGSQFYLTHTAPAHLNGKHTVFGRVLSGLDVARSLQIDDVLDSVTVIRKRDHEYTFETLPDETAPPPILDPTLRASPPDPSRSTSATRPDR